MALIKQIKVGGTTYDVAVKAGNGIAISTSGAVEVYSSSGLRADESGLSVLISGYDSGFMKGLEYAGDTIALKIASGLKFDSLGRIAINLGTGLGINQDGEVCVVS